MQYKYRKCQGVDFLVPIKRLSLSLELRDRQIVNFLIPYNALDLSPKIISPTG